MVARNNNGGQSSSSDSPQCIDYRINLVEPIMKLKIPKRPWERLGVDILEHNGRRYLVLQDYFSKFI